MPARSISAETTLAEDEVAAAALAQILWPLCERVSAQLKEASLAAGAVTLKLKTSDFRLRTRSRRLADPTQLAETMFRIASPLLAAEADGATRFRLIGIGADMLVDAPRPICRRCSRKSWAGQGGSNGRLMRFETDWAPMRCVAGAGCGSAVPADSASRTGRNNRD